MLRVALTAVLLLAVFGCAPKGGNLGRRANAPTPDAVDLRMGAPVAPVGDIASPGR